MEAIVRDWIQAYPMYALLAALGIRVLVGTFVAVKDLKFTWAEFAEVFRIPALMVLGYLTLGTSTELVADTLGLVVQWLGGAGITMLHLVRVKTLIMGDKKLPPPVEALLKAPPVVEPVTTTPP